MKLSLSQKRKLVSTSRITGGGILLALIYPVFADGFSEPIAYINALVIGLLGGLIISAVELEIFDSQKRKFSFLQNFWLKTFTYFFFFALLILIVMGFNESIYYNVGFWEHITSTKFRNFIFEEDYIVILVYSLFFIGIIIFSRQMSIKMGQGVLLSYITGRFHEPKEVERIFMYLDLRSSTTIAEKLGDIRYHEFLHEFFHDITGSILLTKGNIYRYVGDQVTVTWKYREGLKNGSCIRTYFLIKHKLNKLKEKYLIRYGFIPKFSTCFHCGNVIIGEIGDVKSQIVYHGEVLYQTAAIDKKAAELNEEVLLSESLIKKISLPSLYTTPKIGCINKDNYNLDIYTIREQNDVNFRQ